MDRLGDSAKKGLDFIKSAALETVEVQKLGSELKQLEERRRDCVLDMGYRALAAYGTDRMTDEIFADRAEQIEALSARIEEVRRTHADLSQHLRQSVGDILPTRPGSSFKGPDYDPL